MELTMSPTDFVAVFNQTIAVSYPMVTIEGEVANFRIAKGKWVYFDIKDDFSSLRVFGTIYQLSHAVEDGMVVSLVARPELHPLYNFSLQMQTITPRGEGSIKRSFDLLFKKLEAEGLFDVSRKRPLPYPPQRIGLITSDESAAYSDFIKILSKRWPAVSVELISAAVQGAEAASQITAALHHFNLQPDPVETVVIIRGGGSADDLIAFADESLTRAVAESRIPTLVAIGHERDISLAELAADVRASTPSHAAELLVPNRLDVIDLYKTKLSRSADNVLAACGLLRTNIADAKRQLEAGLQTGLQREKDYLARMSLLVSAYDPARVLKRGYALVKLHGKIVRTSKQLKRDDIIDISLHESSARARII